MFRRLDPAPPGDHQQSRWPPPKASVPPPDPRRYETSTRPPRVAPIHCRYAALLLVTPGFGAPAASDARAPRVRCERDRRLPPKAWRRQTPLPILSAPDFLDTKHGLRFASSSGPRCPRPLPEHAVTDRVGAGPSATILPRSGRRARRWHLRYREYRGSWQR